MMQFNWAAKNALYFGDKLAIREFESGRSVSYNDLERLSEYYSNKFVEMGCGYGDRIGIISENRIEHFILFFVCQKLGTILVPINHRLAAPEISYIINDSTPKYILAEDKFRTKFESTWHNNLISLEKCEKEWNAEADSTVLENRMSSPELTENSAIFILYTSGTTGNPKGALYTHKMLFWNSINTQMRLEISSTDHSISVMPLFHTGGWNVIPTPYLHRGASVTLMKKFDPDVLLKQLAEESVTMLVAVPTMIQMITESPVFNSTELPGLRFLIIGGEPLPVDLIEVWQKKGIPVRQGYGLTEAGPSITSLHQDYAFSKRGSIGFPNFYVNYKIVDDEMTEVAVGERGELLLNGPSVSPGYWGKEAPDYSENRWLSTGDIVVSDSEGFLSIVDRKKNMFISGGENVYPAEVEKVLNQHPFIKEAAVIGVLDERWGEAGKAFIVFNSVSELTEKDLTEHCKSKLASYKVPKSFVFLPELPKNDTGKINRKLLQHINQQSH